MFQVGAYEYLCCRAAAESGDTPGDVSRLFVYYVGRLRDKQRYRDSSPIADEGMTIAGEHRNMNGAVANKKQLLSCNQLKG